jgi:hypothetical protein
VVSRGCDAGGIGVIWLRRLFGVEEGVWLAGDVMLEVQCRCVLWLRRLVWMGGVLCSKIVRMLENGDGGVAGWRGRGKGGGGSGNS